MPDALNETGVNKMQQFGHATEEQAEKNNDQLPNWFSVSALYQALIADSNKETTFQRIVFLVCAENNGEAENIGMQFAKAKEHSYLSAENASVSWKFVKIERIDQLFDREFRNGTEVYWEFYEELF